MKKEAFDYPGVIKFFFHWDVVLYVSTENPAFIACFLSIS